MHNVESPTLGQSWIDLVNRIFRLGSPMGEEGMELLGVQVQYPALTEGDAVIREFGDPHMVAEITKVFLTGEANDLGHSYAELMRGPFGKSDLSDIIALLKTEPWSKRALVTFCGEGNGKVPCVNVVQFLVREGSVQAIYFARGQDAFQKFYADGLCLAKMAEIVGAGLSLPARRVRGFIGSSHLYHRDRGAIERMLSAGSKYLDHSGSLKG
jgi:thymidylate synthase